MTPEDFSIRRNFHTPISYQVRCEEDEVLMPEARFEDYQVNSDSKIYPPTHHAVTELNKPNVFDLISDDLLAYSLYGLEAEEV